MAETLLAPSGIKLFGRVVDGLTVDPGKAFPSGGGGFLGDRLKATGMNTLARIFGFSYEGHYYDLPKPAIFLVGGKGDDASRLAPFGGPAATGPTATSTSGVPAKGWEFSSDMRVWTYDKLDVSMRFDIDTGDFERILLQAELMADTLRTNSRGQNAHGQNAFARGQNAFARGQNAFGRGGGSDD